MTEKFKRKAGCDLCKVVFPSQTGVKKMEMFNISGDKVDEYNPAMDKENRPMHKLEEKGQC